MISLTDYVTWLPVEEKKEGEPKGRPVLLYASCTGPHRENGAKPMEQPLRKHISGLAYKIEILKAQAIDPKRTADERYQAAFDLENAERALAAFRQAYDLEQKISN